MAETELNKQHYTAMRLRLEGCTIDEIAEKLKKKRTTVHSWFYKNKSFMAEYEVIRNENVEQARDILLVYAPEAARNIVALAEGKKKGQGRDVSARTQLDANADILDRVGLKPVEKQEVKAEIDHSAEFLAEFDGGQ
ncbi:hypothetical protein ACFO25_09975 [Paenactinomyces guangxiensis]|uniref:Terminase ATPase subunit N-terminal domain-containing protein n=1 Tax=Paenactinomyces guangxiensis TaxID=1490290 RepID=A0A7W1WSB8_9BACL|nr:hypothetical protein [Paenactinomyces guangxiensis]MBA4495112.1 hypothetical protein [Paenactinomyces guangxiensis]MBH8592204.1 hypothetical protein [Paenactinomyces guangxiensis]